MVYSSFVVVRVAALFVFWLLFVFLVVAREALKYLDVLGLLVYRFMHLSLVFLLCWCK